MHGLSFGSKNTKKCAYHGRVDMCDISKNSKVEILAKKNPCVFFFKRGRFTGRWECIAVCIAVICLDGSKDASFFFSFVVLSIFLRDGLRDAREEKVGGGTDFLWGRKAWRVGLVGRGNFTLPLGTRCA